MAIAPTGAIYKSLIFDGEDSRDYGVYITGQVVYNAPEREVEMISIPGRNGAFALDKGRFENIEVTYPAGIFADNETDFAEAISDFRNFLCSRKGYVRLTDEYNPNEYRMAVYKSGLEVSPAQLRAGEFEITFDCKPQRFLTSGEDEITIGQWGEIQTVSGSIATFEGNSATGMKSLVAEIEPIQAGSGTPSPSNPRAISGHTDVVVSRSGGQLIDISTNESGAIDASGNEVANASFNRTQLIPISKGTVFFKSDTPSGYTIRIHGYNNGTWVQQLKAISTSEGYETEITVPSTVNQIRISYPTYGINNTYLYEGDTYTTALGQTVYGGTLDVTSGVLTITKTIVDMGSVNWVYSAPDSGHPLGFFYTTGINQKKAGAQNIIGSAYATGNGAWNVDGVVFGNTNNYTVYVVNSSYTDASAFKTAMTGQTLCYELATPTTVQLTAQQLSAISGINNVWADSGDVTVQYGNAPNMIYNPTLFDARPLLEVEGYGNINIGDDTITLNDVAMGEIAVHDVVSKSSSTTVNPYSYTFTFDDTNLNSGDVITISSAYGIFKTVRKTDYTPTTCTITSTSSATGYCTSSGLTKRVTLENLSFTYGTASTVSGSVLFSQGYKYNNTSYTANETITVAVFYVLPNTLTLRIDTGSLPPCFHVSNREVRSTKVYADSTKSALGHPTYIDLDIGEAYLISNGVPVSLNNVASLPNELPVLKPDGTEITYDNTVTDLKVVPRWWKV